MACLAWLNWRGRISVVMMIFFLSAAFNGHIRAIWCRATVKRFWKSIFPILISSCTCWAVIGETFIATHCCSSSTFLPISISLSSLIFILYIDMDRHERTNTTESNRSSQLMLLSDTINGCGFEVIFLFAFSLETEKSFAKAYVSRCLCIDNRWTRCKRFSSQFESDACVYLECKNNRLFDKQIFFPY